MYTGANVENASYGGAVCAERVAAVKAVCDGESVFEAIAVVGGPHGADLCDGTLEFSYPCGICRQFLREFAAQDMKVYVARAALSQGGGDEKNILSIAFEELLPYSFGPEQLG